MTTLTKTDAALTRDAALAARRATYVEIDARRAADAALAYAEACKEYSRALAHEAALSAGLATFATYEAAFDAARDAAYAVTLAAAGAARVAARVAATAIADFRDDAHLAAWDADAALPM